MTAQPRRATSIASRVDVGRFTARPILVRGGTYPGFGYGPNMAVTSLNHYRGHKNRGGWRSRYSLADWRLSMSTPAAAFNPIPKEYRLVINCQLVPWASKLDGVNPA